MLSDILKEIKLLKNLGLTNNQIIDKLLSMEVDTRYINFLLPEINKSYFPPSIEYNQDKPKIEEISEEEYNRKKFFNEKLDMEYIDKLDLLIEKSLGLGASHDEIKRLLIQHNVPEKYIEYFYEIEKYKPKIDEPEEYIPKQSDIRRISDEEYNRMMYFDKNLDKNLDSDVENYRRLVGNCDLKYKGVNIANIRNDIKKKYGDRYNMDDRAYISNYIYNKLCKK